MFDKGRKKWVRKALYYQKDDGGFAEAYMMFDNRDYELFGRLAGVRSCVEPFVYPVIIMMPHGMIIANSVYMHKHMVRMW